MTWFTIRDHSLEIGYLFEGNICPVPTFRFVDSMFADTFLSSNVAFFDDLLNPLFSI